MAFAASDAHSLSRGTSEYLSAEYAHYHAIRRMGYANANQGVPLSTMIDVICDDGQPTESYWPYLTHVPSPLSAWQPPQELGTLYRHDLAEKTHDLLDRYSQLARPGKTDIADTPHLIAIPSASDESSDHRCIGRRRYGHARSSGRGIRLEREVSRRSSAKQLGSGLG